ncbi:MAG: chlorite dismutase family protein [Nitriliruptoraceae bacterium]
MATEPLRPSQGQGVLHLFFRVDPARRADWTRDDADALAETLERWQQTLQLHLFSTFGHKADVMLMAIDGDLGALRRLQTDVVGAAAGAMTLSWSYLSLTEGSEYMQSAEEYREELVTKDVAEPDLSRRVDEFAERMATYTHDKLYPQMPPWELACFYPMSHRRDGDDNWYALDFPERRRLMHEHGRSGRAYTGRVVQLVSGSTGLDDWEWGVTLFAHDFADLKSIVYQLRYDEASARFAEFGPFVVGMRRTPHELVAEIGLARA